MCLLGVGITKGNYYQKTPTPLRNQPSFFFNDYELPSLTIGELENPLGEPHEIFEEPIGEKEPISPIKTMAEN